MIEIKDGRPIGAPLETAMDGLYLSVKEFAERHQVTQEAVRQWKRRGKIDTICCDGRVYIRANVQIRAKKVGRPLKFHSKNL